MKVLHGLLMGMRCLRVLSLAGYYISELPDSFGELKHLRYLNFSNCSIKRLPDSMGCLYNLQTLILCDCGELTRLPMGIGMLINLRHFVITGASKLTKRNTFPNRQPYKFANIAKVYCEQNRRVRNRRIEELFQSPRSAFYFWVA